MPAAPTRPSLVAYGIPAALNAHGGAQGVPGMPQGWLQSTPGTPSYRQRHAPKPTIHANGMQAATSGARGPDPIPASDSRTGPFGRPPPRVPANRAQPGKAEYHGSLMMTGRSHSRAHTDSSVPLGPNPISVSDFRIGPWKQAVLQAATIRTHPKTAESRSSRNQDKPIQQQPQHPERAKPYIVPRFPVQSTDTTGTAVVTIQNHTGAAEYQGFRDAAHRKDHRFHHYPQTVSDFGVRFPNQSRP